MVEDTLEAENARRDIPADGSASHAAQALRLVRRLATSRYASVVAAIVAACIYLTITQPAFMTLSNWQNIIGTQSVVMLLSIGATIVVLTGGVDLSVGSLTAVALMALGIAIQDGGSWIVGCLAAVAAGAALGLVNGVLIGVLRISFFVVTLGAMSIYQSVALLTNGGSTISLLQYRGFSEIGTLVNGSVGPIPTILIIGLVLYVGVSAVLHLTPFGRAIFAVGANPEAARLVGINVGRINLLVYTLAGLSAGMGAIALSGRLGGAAPTVDPNLMPDVLAAVLIGGTAFTGGSGGLLGTLIGVLFLGIVQNGLELSNISTNWQGAVSGTILIVAVGLGLVRGGRWRSWLGRAPRPQTDDGGPTIEPEQAGE